MHTTVPGKAHAQVTCIYLSGTIQVEMSEGPLTKDKSTQSSGGFESGFV